MNNLIPKNCIAISKQFGPMPYLVGYYDAEGFVCEPRAFNQLDKAMDYASILSKKYNVTLIKRYI